MLLSIVGLPKPFRGHIGVIQRNAIESWRRLGPDCEVILVGTDEGTAEVSEQLGVRHVPDVACNATGTPLVSDVLRIAEEHGSAELVCYVNADIVLFDDMLHAIRTVRQRLTRFLIMGRRTDLDVTEPLAFDAGWQDALRSRARDLGATHSVTGIDYFVFTRGLWGDVPPMAVGRTIWDNWLLFRARQRGGEIVDASEQVLAIHQNHAYGKRSADEIWSSPEAKTNERLAGGRHHVFTALDATWTLGGSGLRRAATPRHLWRHAITWPMLRMGWELPTRIALRGEHGLIRVSDALWGSRRRSGRGSLSESD